jgi:Collagen triple helix repeat (20 copies)
MLHRAVATIRRNLVAWLALFVALGGTSVAASHYLVTSTKQIKPSVLKELHGATGPAGPAGPAGPRGSAAAAGAPGAVGPQGPAGTNGSNGARGETGIQGIPGTNGTPIIARPRSVSSVETASTPNPHTPIFKEDALAGAAWTQGPQGLEQLMGEVQIASPSEAQCGAGTGPPPNGGTAVVTIELNGSVIAEARSLAGKTAATRLYQLKWTSTKETAELVAGFASLQETTPILIVYDPGASTPRTLTANVADDCGFENAQTGGHFTVNLIRVDVLGAE